jgi:hypothetical protein
MSINNFLALVVAYAITVLVVTSVVRPEHAIALSLEHDVVAVLTRVVPDEASVSYSVGGRVVQSMPLRAGTYRITVERLR